jgi:pyrroline-5-carboxylate reductase
MKQESCSADFLCKIGFIGYGSMGSMLLKNFITVCRVHPADIIISTRTRSKLDIVKSTWDGIHIAQDNCDAAQKARYVFLCVKPLEVKSVLEEIKDCITRETHIISLAGPVRLHNIEMLANVQVSKLTPTLTSEVCEGVSLLCHGSKVTLENAAFIENLLQQISHVKILHEGDFELAAEITSCGPGLLAALFQEFVHSAERHTRSISREDLEEMLMRTLFGTVKLYLERK